MTTTELPRPDLSLIADMLEFHNSYDRDQMKLQANLLRAFGHACRVVDEAMVERALHVWFRDCGGANELDLDPDGPMFEDMRAALSAALEPTP